MNPAPSETVAVLSGDVVNSTKLAAADFEQLLHTLQQCFYYISQQHSANTYEISRGDAFQIIIHDPENALLYALLIRTGLRRFSKYFDCRISVGLGSDNIIRNHVGKSTGEAFTLSGRSLDKMSAQRLVIVSPQTAFNQNMELLTQYADFHLSELSERQAGISHYLLLSRAKITHAEIAAALGASRTSITRSINKSHLDLLNAYALHSQQQIKDYLL